MKLDMIAFEAEMKRLRGAYIMDIAPACEMYRAALARAEAAEAEAEDAILVASDAAQREENAMHALSHFRARVAELEAQLAAQQWRPGSETPNAIDTYLVYRAAPPQNEPWRYDFAVWGDDGWDTEGFTHYRPLPPAPQETE